MDIHSIIKQFENQAGMLDVIEQATDLEDALISLATWLYLSQDLLPRNDITLLIEVGGILYREGLERRRQRWPNTSASSSVTGAARRTS